MCPVRERRQPASTAVTFEARSRDPASRPVSLGVSYEERRKIQAEAIPLILDGFHKKRVSARGDYYKFDVSGDWEIFPQSIQQPHPPMYMGAGTNESIATAARYGFGSPTTT